MKTRMFLNVIAVLISIYSAASTSDEVNAVCSRYSNYSIDLRTHKIYRFLNERVIGFWDGKNFKTSRNIKSLKRLCKSNEKLEAYYGWFHNTFLEKEYLFISE